MRTIKALTLDDAKLVAAAAEAEAISRGWAVSIAICDAGGHALWLQRMDGAPLMSAAVAPEKARTCVLRNAYEITSRFDCALGHATCLLGCSENSKGNAAWAITGKT